MGVLLVVGCTAGFVVMSLQLGGRQPVLALARPITVGQVLSTQDLTQVSVAADDESGLVPAVQASSVVGQTMAVSLPAGSLLTRNELGRAAVPPVGQAIAALALKPGQFPPDVAAGASVLVVLVPATSGSPVQEQQGAVWQATVTAVQVRADEQTTVVSVQLAESDARQIAAVPPGQLSIVMVSGGGR